MVCFAGAILLAQTLLLESVCVCVCKCGCWRLSVKYILCCIKQLLNWSNVCTVKKWFSIFLNPLSGSPYLLFTELQHLQSGHPCRRNQTQWRFCWCFASGQEKELHRSSEKWHPIWKVLLHRDFRDYYYSRQPCLKCSPLNKQLPTVRSKNSF